MIPRECDNDDCDYEPYTCDDGRTVAQWVHVESCEGPMESPDMEQLVKNAPEGSFLAYMMGRK